MNQNKEKKCMKEELLKGLTKEQIEKLNKCKSNKEILALAKEEGIELSKEQLDAVSGGACVPDGDTRNPRRCPLCHHTNTKLVSKNDMGRIAWDVYLCLDCKVEYRIVNNQY